MDWPRENMGISEKDFRNVFKYEPKVSRVVKIMSTDPAPAIDLLETPEEWEDWLDVKLPSPQSGPSGLVLILARRPGHNRVSQDDMGRELPSKLERSATFPDEVGVMPDSEKGPVPSQNGRRSASTMPFSMETFKLISRRFFMHGSIARVVNRSDVPIFSRAELHMGSPEGPAYPAYVYNCRSSNAWERDLALSVTHFPRSRLTYAVMFGCPASVEQNVIDRLLVSMAEASHPLLLPGIFAELERNRHMEIVESTMDSIEESIFRLDNRKPTENQMQDPELETRNCKERSAWLDTTYLRNGLQSWRKQLEKMLEHVEELKDQSYSRPELGVTWKLLNKLNMDETSAEQTKGIENSGIAQFWEKEECYKQCTRVSMKIKDRLKCIIDEYEEKIRECTMRVDGVAMATQWSHGETNVEIALAAGRDSRHMRSIAVVTMVFLPGTFFASVFSMGFFNWLPEDNDSVISRYFWIYVLATVSTTLITLGAWYYFIVWRQKRHRFTSDEEHYIL
ncbi:uncharacterized protein BCR38DRAFT_69850 [Pseudomassariella vexata]|uniref:Cora-like Mg2+ transporter protein-domain-containing protein n=1 Tax=Pseudomassariella vexata TaxID=1141098 RepID=A0A1Y2DI23_9PEZI|nr:uncharacterized protein BCR38DRAFT_69850 [Pseudomassariella vexata]ORY58784.1 hypothetical protein BCR38DRAFT_69850 [Pseudomassariella vexata]